MAAGLPIIASDVPGTCEALADAGLLYPINDSTLFFDAAVKLFSNPSLRATLGARAKERVSQFSLDRIVENYIRVYTELC